ncbi:MAG: hypothetical protein GXY50_04370 [Syntrophomonadaceae bacterium]|nr:hypothetical protein [Syntrophomonadaceae bacterium]
MNKGDLLNVYLNGVLMTICVIGSYKEEYSGEEVVVLALVSPDNMLHVPLSDLNAFYPVRKVYN